MKQVVTILLILALLAPIGFAAEHNEPHVEEEHVDELHIEEHADEQQEEGIHSHGDFEHSHQTNIETHEEDHGHAHHAERGEANLTTIAWTLGSVLLVSLIALIGIIALGIKRNILSKIMGILVAVAAGTLLADALLHLLPHYAEEFGFSTTAGALVLGGILLMLIVERLVHWHHCHDHHLCANPTAKHDHSDHIHSFGWTILAGDALHNFLDGVIIAASYLVSVPVGIATTIAVILHEIPQEIADFGVLLHAGFSKARALMVNFATALTAILGAITVLILEANVGLIEYYLIPITAGAFIYIGGTDLLPELKRDDKRKDVLIHLAAFLVGIGFMIALFWLPGH